MRQESMTIYQSNLVTFDEVKNVLGSMCGQERSGVFLIVADNGDGAGFTLEQGRIVDAAYKLVRGNDALICIKNIGRARFFFEQGQAVFPPVANAPQDLPDTAKVLSFLDIHHDIEKHHDEAVAPSIKGRIAIVDDSRLVRTVVKRILLKENYEVIEIENGEKALPIIEKERPGLVLLDVVMPGIDGNEVLRRIRATDFGKQLPVIFLTSTDSLIDANSDANDCMPKPFKPDDLLQNLSKYLSPNKLNAA